MSLRKNFSYISSMVVLLVMAVQVSGQTFFKVTQKQTTSTISPQLRKVTLAGEAEVLSPTNTIVREEQQEENLGKKQNSNKCGSCNTDDCEPICVKPGLELDFSVIEVFDLSTLAEGKRVRLSLETNAQINGVTVINNNAYAQAEVVKFIKATETRPASIFLLPKVLYTASGQTPVDLKGSIMELRTYELIYRPVNEHILATTEVQFYVCPPCCK